jgi:hypothetical protein
MHKSAGIEKESAFHCGTISIGVYAVAEREMAEAKECTQRHSSGSEDTDE